ncbi:MAG: hypothetical protein ABIG44_18015 [Planctomycetota bacterium]
MRVSYMIMVALAILTLLGVVAATGCTHVITRNTPYYEDGPFQPDPPQGELPAGTKVWIVGKKGSYSLVWSLDGVIAYVWDGAVMTIREWDRQQKEQDEAQRENEKILIEP